MSLEIESANNSLAVDNKQGQGTVYAPTVGGKKFPMFLLLL
jgi:hypothetical protein